VAFILTSPFIERDYTRAQAADKKILFRDAGS
jgi:hypothetical protein